MSQNHPTGPGSPGGPPIHSDDARPSIRICPVCGYRGEGVFYFQRSAHAALLAGATLFTYGIGGLIYWGIKRRSRVCPSCGTPWQRTAPWPGGGAAGSELPPGPPPSQPGRLDLHRPDGDPEPLPRGGMFRRVVGSILMLLAVVLVGTAVIEGEIGLLVPSMFFGLGGAGSFAWGWRSMQRRREAILQSLQSQTLQMARRRGGRLTATEVASELDLSLIAAERVLLSMDDGFRVRSDVTDEGLLIFEFPEILLRELSGDVEGAEPGA